jgi:hypothetical protein
MGLQGIRSGVLETTFEFDQFLKGLVALPGQYALPDRLTATAAFDDGVTAEVDIEVSVERAIARRVTVYSPKVHGVGWKALGELPVRDIVATAALDALHRMEPAGRGRQFTWRKVNKDDDGARWQEIRDLIQHLVGYNPNPEAFDIAEKHRASVERTKKAGAAIREKLEESDEA